MQVIRNSPLVFNHVINELFVELQPLGLMQIATINIIPRRKDTIAQLNITLSQDETLHLLAIDRNTSQRRSSFA